MQTKSNPKPRRSFFEVPIMEERKWSKVPEIQADVFMLDIEDSCPPDLKTIARGRIIDLVRDPSYLGGREYMVRPNSLETEWGRADIEALAKAGVPFIVYPKARDADEVREVARIFEQHGSIPELMLIIETPQAVLRLESLAMCPGVTALLMGPGDLSMETGTSLLDGEEIFHDGFVYARSKVVIAARAFGLQPVDAIFTADLKNLDAVRRTAQLARRMGSTGLITFYPPHVPIINEVMSPTLSELAWARRVVTEIDEGKAKWRAALTIDGKWITVHQYDAAKKMIAIAESLA
jgi:citrate lyase beta subunit